ncbi:hypothetical protein TKWG_14225 [Advenella kashmirensis WT001]|uniref:Hedgehog/Intein (Hint) domain-containing protein n=1 Tax=Advenella kashmirensis (strain DSM 17095 / LMG 22695 / WT001) TaxID=1036672 RepID=I3UD35_ADVKW|nr:Hint domain-containing protein [Advenella kashmirensis]AFK62923.1 hypothetical protein TKWG_14225 [Advenella kashmirensis WT001]
MATYTTGYWYFLTPQDPELKTFSVDPAASGEVQPFIARESVNDGVLKVGETIEIEYVGDDPGGPPASYKIEGFFGDGYVLNQSFGYALYSNTRDIKGPITLETEETGYPGLPIVPPVCFTKGTLIETAEGHTPIENLKAGDMVVGSKGLGRVKWVGWRNFTLSSFRASVAMHKQSAPVRIKRGALDEGIPHADLIVSPWHHIFIDGVLVRANNLINGQTIVQDLNVKHVEYFHVELDQFDVIRTHGVFSESWADGGNRSFFENVEITSLRPEETQRKMAERPGFAVLRDRNEINAIKIRMLLRANSLIAEEKAA